MLEQDSGKKIVADEIKMVKNKWASGETTAAILFFPAESEKAPTLGIGTAKPDVWRGVFFCAIIMQHFTSV